MDELTELEVRMTRLEERSLTHEHALFGVGDAGGLINELRNLTAQFVAFRGEIRSTGWRIIIGTPTILAATAAIAAVIIDHT